jgi:AcrR family transcriptional regulator
LERSTRSRRGGGRPTREEAVRRDARLFDVAKRLFIDRGFEATTMDAVAEMAGVSKPTLYARYRDKRELFGAVLRNMVHGSLTPIFSAAAEQHAMAPHADIEATLHQVSREMLCSAALPECAALNRIVAAQAMQFPELARLALEEGWLRGVQAIAALLQQFNEQGHIHIDDPELAASMFLDLVFGHTWRMALYGLDLDPTLAEQQREAAVKLFLDGVRAR